jgi:sugar lactone lactonase YvrE
MTRDEAERRRWDFFNSLIEEPMTRNTGRKLWLGLGICAVLLPNPGRTQDTEVLRVEHLMDVQADFSQPTEVAVGEGGEIFVLDGVNGQVKVFDERGNFLSAIGSPGEGEGRLRHPVGMDLDSLGNVYIADTGNRRVQVFNRAGACLRTIDLNPLKARPVDVLVGEEGGGRLYVSEREGHRILVLTLDGAFVSAWGEYGEHLGQFRFPGMMALDAEGAVYVVDVLNTRIQVFNPTGSRARQIGEWGVRPGQLFRPKGVALGPDATLYVSDSYTGVIQAFEETGRYRGVLADREGRLLRLTTPVGMAFDRKGRLYVVEMEINKVSVFRIGGAG